MKRIVLFLATNLAVMLVLSVVVHLVGADRWLYANGLNVQQLLIFAAIFGMGGAFISLAMSKSIAKWTTGARVIDQPQSSAEAWLLQTVQRLARSANIGMPEVAIYDGPEMNAFATGMSKNKALVAVSSGLLHSMNQDEVEAVLGHEISHVANGDMVTLTLIQGVLNTFVIFLARVVGYVVDNALRGGRDDNRGGAGIGYFFTVMVLEMLFGILASMIVAWFSRYREYRADAGGAHLAGKRKMISALQRLGAAHPSTLPQQMSAFGINGGGVRQLFASHPPIEQRIARLQAAA
ncbi:MAG TPA: protease HtpX [Nevskiaceae bacterium]|nr:protease HtpX [Nevskiaceae bacterium]